MRPLLNLERVKINDIVWQIVPRDQELHKTICVHLCCIVEQTVCMESLQD